jgi:hypothetical protein
VIALTALLWLNAGCATQGPPVDPFPVAADLAAPKVDRTGPRADDASPSGPVDPATIARLLAEAEDAYEGARWGQALEAFKAVTAFDSANPQAWLRISIPPSVAPAGGGQRLPKAGSGAQGGRDSGLGEPRLGEPGAGRRWTARERLCGWTGRNGYRAEALGAEHAGQSDALERSRGAAVGEAGRGGRGPARQPCPGA